MAGRRGKARRQKRPAVKHGQPGTRVRVKGHVRTPRGPNRGKSAVRVKGYSRRRPRER